MITEGRTSKIIIPSDTLMGGTRDAGQQTQALVGAEGDITRSLELIRLRQEVADAQIKTTALYTITALALVWGVLRKRINELGAAKQALSEFSRRTLAAMQHGYSYLTDFAQKGYLAILGRTTNAEVQRVLAEPAALETRLATIVGGAQLSPGAQANLELLKQHLKLQSNARKIRPLRVLTGKMRAFCQRFSAGDLLTLTPAIAKAEEDPSSIPEVVPSEAVNGRADLVALRERVTNPVLLRVSQQIVRTNATRLYPQEIAMVDASLNDCELSLAGMHTHALNIDPEVARGYQVFFGAATTPATQQDGQINYTWQDASCALARHIQLEHQAFRDKVAATRLTSNDFDLAEEAAQSLPANATNAARIERRLEVLVQLLTDRRGREAQALASTYYEGEFRRAFRQHEIRLADVIVFSAMTLEAITDNTANPNDIDWAFHKINSSDLVGSDGYMARVRTRIQRMVDFALADSSPVPDGSRFVGFMASVLAHAPGTLRGRFLTLYHWFTQSAIETNTSVAEPNPLHIQAVNRMADEARQRLAEGEAARRRRIAGL